MNLPNIINQLAKSNEKFKIVSDFTPSGDQPAAIKTLEIMEKTKSWEVITSIGQDIQKKWKIIAKRNAEIVETATINHLIG